MERFVGILRSENALTVRRVRQIRTVDFEDNDAVSEAFSDGSISWYEFADGPLPSSYSKLREDWDALAGAAILDTDRAQRVLAETVLGQPSSLPPLLLFAPPVPVKPTAAHPRAFQGTKYKPPTAKSVPVTDWRPSLCDPRRFESVAAEARLPDTFRVSLYPLVRDTAAEALALYWALDLDGSPERLAATAFLFSLQTTRNTHTWCRLIVSQPPEFWTPLLRLVIASGAYAAEIPLRFGAMLAEVLAGKDPFYRAYWLLHGLTTQIDPAYLMDGYRLADACGKNYVFFSIERSDYFPLAATLRWGDHCRNADNFYPDILLSLWEECGLRAGLGQCLEQADCTQMTPDAATRFLKLLHSSWDNWGDLEDNEADAKWAAVRPMMAEIIELISSVPAAYQDKCVWHLDEYIWQWDDPAKLNAILPVVLILIRRLCHPPFAEKNNSTNPATDFLANLSIPLRERFLSAPDSSFRRMEQSCRHGNASDLIGQGTGSLTRHQAEFSVYCFESDPTRFFHAAKLLGTLPKPMRESVAKAFKAASGEAPRLSLARLEQAATEALAQGFPPEARAQAELHALQIQQLIQDNRKALRRFLAAHWEGRTDYRQSHPLTQRWLAAHPTLDLDKWLAGVVVQTETETWGGVTLATERDPMEALKLGTYVGSCLGLGGAFTHSAAAVVLDINKQVVYARNKRGTVAGRQLVAISEANELVCYEVYPLNAQKELGAAFAAFDTQLASALGLPIYCPNDEEDYEIAPVLSHRWWDDCAWNLVVDKE